MMNRRYGYHTCSILIVLSVIAFFLSCASKAPILYREDGSPLLITDYEKIAQRERDERRYDNAIAAYAAIIANYPDNKTALAWAHYEIGFCYYLKEDFDQAEFYFRIVLNEYQEPAADTLAEMMIGKIGEERELKRQRKERWKRKPKEETE
jgi:tetratricopeptide (TPR) repeat protein